jgi:RHS repeat-associated protein
LLTGNRSFGLDTAGRVIAVTGREWAERYAYDPAGNVAAATWPVPPAEMAAPWLDADSQGPREFTGTLIGRAGNVRYRHDAAGRVIERTRTRISRKPETWRYSWDAGNRLVSAVTPDGSMWQYAYDPLGRHIAKQHVDPDGRVLGETRFTWDGPVLAEQVESVPSGEQVTTWDYRPGTFTPLAQTTHASLRDAPQEVIDERFYAIITDLTGAPSELVAPDGTLAGYQQHTLWGNTIWHPGGTSTPLRFPGQYADDETGLHYNNQRYYDPVSGSYLSPDPLGLAPAPNPHAYVPNPHVLTDPLGLEPGSPGGPGAGGYPAQFSESGPTDLVPYDPQWASRQLLDQNFPGSSGYAVTPEGRTISAHAAERIALGGPGRPPTSMATVDQILNTGTSIRYDPIRDTIQVRAPGMPGRPYVVVNNTGQHIVTVMVPK